MSLAKHQNMSALQEPRTNTSENLYGSGVIVRAMVEKKSQQHKKRGGYGGDEGGSRVMSFLGQVQVQNARASPGHLGCTLSPTMIYPIFWNPFPILALTPAKVSVIN
jgi:hypothetical protein